MTGKEILKRLRATYDAIDRRAQEFTLNPARNREIADAYDNQRLGALEMLRAAERRSATDAAAGWE